VPALEGGSEEARRREESLELRVTTASRSTLLVLARAQEPDQLRD